MDRTQEMLRADGACATTPSDLYQAICEDAAERVDANYVSIWRFDAESSKIVCLHAFDAETGNVQCGQELFRADCPTYFQAILEETTICAPDARSHPLTSELTEGYFDPLGIVSLLDIVVHRAFVPVGIICCESRRRRRDWSDQDRSYLLQLATLTSFRGSL